MNRKHILILGGARSGKSRFALDLAGRINNKVLFVATAEALDEEMKTRIAEHQHERPRSWQTLETPRNLAGGIAERIGNAEVVIIDCLTLLVSNLMLGEERGKSGETEDADSRVMTEMETLAEFMQETSATFIIVSNEVGLGLVPESKLGRAYGDLLGRANQLIARYASEVYFMVAGIPMKVKG
ncbi:MAG TPA: bifunctional adenosylcobinamide kinase/adenosylcobinamide-phosphate guanylyltransferase [Dehalococcoidia bacterium]|nr:bifunctional adenosylcobinamide kinase/adenosylcobinamide-phosphate guanylyltransferase [Dehalococcoidia bacterium]